MTGIYSKSSFDRFGDDLCALILGYLQLEDGIKYECVSHQWKRTVYQRVNKLVIRPTKQNDLMEKLFSLKQLNGGVPALASLLRKCPNITEFDAEPLPYLIRYTNPGLYTSIVNLMTKYCSNLRSINNCPLGLGHTFIESIGLQLETICLYNCKKHFEKLICERFPSLRRLEIYSGSVKLFDGSNQKNFSIKRLTHLKFSCSNNEEDFLRTIIRNNKQLKSLVIKPLSHHSITSEELLNQLSDLTQLKSLTIRLSINVQTIDTILDKFKIIGQNCTQMKKLSISDSFCNKHLRLKWLTVLGYYPNLVSLEISSPQNKDSSFVEPRISCELLANCPKLRYFILDMIELNISFFEDIHKYVPKLRHLSLNYMKTNEIIIDYIEKLPEIQTVVLDRLLSNNKQRIDHAKVYKLFRNCPRLKSIYLIYFYSERYHFYRNYHGGIKLYQIPSTWLKLKHRLIYRYLYYKSVFVSFLVRFVR